MPVEAKPLSRPEVLRPHLAASRPTAEGGPARGALSRWAGLLGPARAESPKEQGILTDSLGDVFRGPLGYTRAVDKKGRSSFTREGPVAVAGKYADAVPGDFRPGRHRLIVAIGGKGPKGPLDGHFSAAPEAPPRARAPLRLAAGRAASSRSGDVGLPVDPPGVGGEAD